MNWTLHYSKVSSTLTNWATKVFSYDKVKHHIPHWHVASQMQQPWLKRCHIVASSFPTTSINDATHPPLASSACHNATTTMKVARSSPAQVSNTTPLPASSLTPMVPHHSWQCGNQMMMWQLSDTPPGTTMWPQWPCDHNGHVTTCLHQPWGLTTTHQQPPTTTLCHCPQTKMDHPQMKTTTHEWRLPPMPTNETDQPQTKSTACEQKRPPTNVNGCRQRRTDTGNDTQTWAMTCGHRQRCVDTSNDAQTQATMHGHGQRYTDTGNHAQTWETRSRRGQWWADMGNDEPRWASPLHYSTPLPLPSIAPPPSITPTTASPLALHHSLLWMIRNSIN